MSDELNILILEDDPGDAELATQALRKAGIKFSFRRVDTRHAFVAALNEYRPDIILADYRLPAFDGLAALDIAVDQAPDVPFVFISGTVGEEFAIETLHRGAADYVLKNRLSKLPPAVTRALKEAAERNLRRKLAAIVESSEDAIFSTTLENRITTWNRGAVKMLGYGTDEIVGQSISILVPPGREQEIAGLLAAVGNGKSKAHYESSLRSKDGRSIEVSLSMSPIRNSSGTISGISTITRDITERHRAEEQLRIAATAFEIHEGMIITDANQAILRVNRAFTRITGYAPDDVVGETPRLLKSGHHDSDFYSAMWDCIQSEGCWEGEILNRRKSGEIYPEWLSITAVKNNLGEITHYVGAFVDITARKAADKEIEHLAYFDPLTHLPNRRLLLDRLQQALAGCTRTRRLGAVLFLDLDNFKMLNNTCGHYVGDQLLIKVADRLTRCVRDGDTISRLGGDEFVVILEDLHENTQEAAAQAKAVGEKILASLNRRYVMSGRVHHSTPSIGATLFGDRESSADELLKQADIAMYQAKSAGRNTLRFFDPDMQAVLTVRAELETALRQGIERHQFVLVYQPQVDDTRGIVGAEALLRWEHPERGTVSPVQFIPLAEETGLILSIGQWVLEEACARLKVWAADPRTRELRLAINVSAHQFRQADFVDQVTQALERSGAPAACLKLELTESLVLDDIEGAIKKMYALKQRGVGFSMDDFGTGYSSLSYLTRLPLDQLKIDQSFVHNLPESSNDAVIVQTIITMARSLDLEVIAEGVETEAQRQFLEQHGCPVFQGYLLSKPVALAVFEKLLMHS